MKLPQLVAILISSSMLIIACASTSQQGNKVLKQQAYERKLHHENTVLLDVRTPEEYNEGHLKNAVLLDYNGGLFDSAFMMLAKEKTYLIYCRSGMRSDNAATKMKTAGFKKVYQLKNGIKAWKGDIETK